MTARRKRKLRRRILIAETLLELHLTYVNSQGSEVWFCMQDIRDCWDAGIIPGGTRKSTHMTDQELVNRLKTILALDCITKEYRDYTWAGVRRRQIYFRLDSEEGLREYISMAKEAKERLE